MQSIFGALAQETAPSEAAGGYSVCVLSEAPPWRALLASATAHLILIAVFAALIRPSVSLSPEFPRQKVIAWINLRQPERRVVFFAPVADAGPVAPSKPSRDVAVEGVALPAAAAVPVPAAQSTPGSSASPPKLVSRASPGPAVLRRPLFPAPTESGFPAAIARLIGSHLMRDALETSAAPLPAPAVPGKQQLPGGGIRIIHPDNAVFDVVIVQNVLPDEEVRHSLQSRPVYTAYVETGGDKEWVLHYGAPGTVSPRSQDRIVVLGSASEVAGPAPRVTVFPPQGILLDHPGRTLLHGYITAEGRFRELTAVRPERQELARVLLPLLDEWRFRPALRDGAAVEVEVLIGIPSYAEAVASGQ